MEDLLRDKMTPGEEISMALFFGSTEWELLSQYRCHFSF